MDGWLRNPNKHWLTRFHEVGSSWSKNQSVIVDHDRAMPGDESALLMPRLDLWYENAAALWFQFNLCGWTVSDAVW